MISVTMDLMDMSELPDLSSSAQVTNISTFSAQPPPTGEYFVYTFFDKDFCFVSLINMDE